MKKIIGIILLLLLFIAIWVGLSLVFYNGGLSLRIAIILPLCCYIGAVLLVGFVELVTWLLN